MISTLPAKGCRTLVADTLKGDHPPRLACRAGSPNSESWGSEFRYGQRISKGDSMTLASAGARPDTSSPL
jgi:hypothetical protein